MTATSPPRQAPGFERKMVSLQALLERRAEMPEPVVFTNGVFDILHRGHVTYLASARALGACLIVGVNSDASVRMLGKGDDRPINLEADRMALLAALGDVDGVVCFDEQTPVELIRALRPDILVKGGDYDMDKLPESALVRSWGGQALAIAFEHERSTTALLKKVRGASASASASVSTAPVVAPVQPITPVRPITPVA